VGVHVLPQEVQVAFDALVVDVVLLFPEQLLGAL